jgi:hypothetical protein
LSPVARREVRRVFEVLATRDAEKKSIKVEKIVEIRQR